MSRAATEHDVGQQRVRGSDAHRTIVHQREALRCSHALRPRPVAWRRSFPCPPVQKVLLGGGEGEAQPGVKVQQRNHVVQQRRAGPHQHDPRIDAPQEGAPPAAAGGVQPPAALGGSAGGAARAAGCSKVPAAQHGPCPSRSHPHMTACPCSSSLASTTAGNVPCSPRPDSCFHIPIMPDCAPPPAKQLGLVPAGGKLGGQREEGSQVARHRRVAVDQQHRVVLGGGGWQTSFPRQTSCPGSLVTVGET